MGLMQDWNGNTIEVAFSKGGTMAVSNPLSNLVLPESTLLPPPEILQKMYMSNQGTAFIDENLALSSKWLGYYCDIQSIHSEDAITWSFFGTLLHISESSKAVYASELLHQLRIDCTNVLTPIIWLWRRIPHPDTLVSGGPEIDFAIHCGNVVLLGEAKWLSGVGVKQGKRGDKNQLTLRLEFFQKYGKRLFPTVTEFVLLAVSLTGGIIQEKAIQHDGIAIHLRDTTWDFLSLLASLLFRQN